MNILTAFKRLPFLPKMAKHDVIKTPFSQKIINGFFLNFGGGRQINVKAAVTESFTSISATVYELSKNPAGGGRICPPPPARRVLR